MKKREREKELLNSSHRLENSEYIHTIENKLQGISWMPRGKQLHLHTASGGQKHSAIHVATE